MNPFNRICAPIEPKPTRATSGYITARACPSPDRKPSAMTNSAAPAMAQAAETTRLAPNRSARGEATSEPITAPAFTVSRELSDDVRE